METEQNHLSKAERNERLAESLAGIESRQEDWAVTVAFYAALHYIQAYLSRSKAQIRGHQDRFEAIKKDPKLRDAYSDYQYLYTWSMWARYYCCHDPEPAYDDAKGHLAAVKRRVHHALTTSIASSSLIAKERA